MGLYVHRPAVSSKKFPRPGQNGEMHRNEKPKIRENRKSARQLAFSAFFHFPTPEAKINKAIIPSYGFKCQAFCQLQGGISKIPNGSMMINDQTYQRVRQLCGGKLWLLVLTILNVPWKMRSPAVRRQGRWKTLCRF